MCGIAGIYQKQGSNETLMEEMLQLLEHRGPDHSAVFQHGPFTLGHRRLSIIGIEDGNQPIFNEDKTVAVIFNGEIYNYEKIKASLLQKGHRFSTNTDTEILVHAYEEWGVEFFQNLNGIFAFTLLDMNQNRLLLVRDQFGIKPLHYYHKSDFLVFASEQKSILLHPYVERKLNYQSLHSQLNLRYTQSDDTLFDGIKRLPPAHYLDFKDGKIEINKYWQLDARVKKNMTEAEAIHGMHFYIKQAVQRQLMSEVPLGVYLSGGLDSSTIVQKMHELGVDQINTFTMGFNEPTDEFPDAEQVARHFNTNHRTLSLDMNPMQQFPEVIWHAEEPKINLLQGFNMSSFVKKDITVVLGGLGGDELFAGYDIHRFLHPFNQLNKLMPGPFKALGKWKSSLLYHLQLGIMTFDEYRRALQVLMSTGDIMRMYLIMRNEWDFDSGMYKKIYSKSYLAEQRSNLEPVYKSFAGYFEELKDASDLEKVLYTEFHTKMVNDYLLVEDRMSMANSVEERVPFLDLDLVEYAFSIPLHLKIKGRQTKYLFRKAMQEYLPEHIIKKKKWGFTVNPYMQFKKDLEKTARRILTEDFVDRQGIFNYKYLKQIMDHKPHPKMRWHYNYLWVVMGMAIWQKMFIDTDMFKEKKVDLENFYND